MKKVNFRSLILFLPVSLLSLFVISCNEEEVEVSVQEIESVIAKLPVISAERAAKIGIKAVTHLKYGDNVVNSRAGEFVVKEVRKYPEASRSNDKYCYLINFEEGGYAVVAPNGEVLAMNDEGAFSPEENEADDYFMHFASNYVETLSLEPEPVPFDSTEIINPEPAFIWHNGHRCGIKSNFSTPILAFYLLKTTWHQDYPYNYYCPKVDDGNNNGNLVTAPVGCSPLALARIMTYHKKPASYNGYEFKWEQMDETNSYYLNDIVKDIAYLCRQIGIEAKTTYKYNNSSTFFDDLFNSLTKFNYNQALKLNDYSESIILSELSQQRPMLIRAEESNVPDSGHMWIIDGAHQTLTTYTYTNLDTGLLCYEKLVYTTYLHCNWGWGNFNDKNNGYYLSKVFNPKIYSQQINFNTKFRLIYNIK